MMDRYSSPGRNGPSSAAAGLASPRAPPAAKAILVALSSFKASASPGLSRSTLSNSAAASSRRPVCLSAMPRLNRMYSIFASYSRLARMAIMASSNFPALISTCARPKWDITNFGFNRIASRRWTSASGKRRRRHKSMPWMYRVRKNLGEARTDCSIVAKGVRQHFRYSCVVATSMAIAAARPPMATGPGRGMARDKPPASAGTPRTMHAMWQYLSVATSATCSPARPKVGSSTAK
mmetsp:Transcript_11705/g.33697  ORF Transcript_11705/g.33697 Transcript_11705/m.33697 type:complete len:236 (+) Transcript_11705:236-943(+)